MKKLFSLIALVAMAGTMMAQQIQPLPIDTAVRYGRLSNGLTYYIRHNETPKNRAEFQIAQAVGAILEEDDQNGLAHFLEHMCFNGTEHFPGKQIITYMESIGVNFGGNINAYTSLDKTVYRLSDVPTTREGIIDTALLVLHDWSCAVSLLPEEIDAERGVIREEWRTGATASRRMWKEANRKMYPGSQYAKRDVIGDTAVINNFSYDALRAYYHKWYGPDLQAIVVIGDIDVDEIEFRLKQLFAPIPARPNRGERPYYNIPDNDAPIVALVQDPEAQHSLIQVLFKHEPLPAEVKASAPGFLQSLCHSLIYRMLSERMQDISMKPDAPILGAYMEYGSIFPTLDAFYCQAAAKEGQEREAYELLLREIERMRRYGFTEDELSRAKDDLRSSYEKSYNDRANRRNVHLVQNCLNHYLDGEPMPGLEWEYNCVTSRLPMVTAEMLSNLAASYVSSQNVVVCFEAPLKETVKLPSEDEARQAVLAMPELAIEAPAAQAKDYRLVKKTPRAGKIKAEKYNQKQGTTEWTLSNGIRVILKPTTFKQDEILFSAVSEGGLSLVAERDLCSAVLATDVVEFAGLGDLTLLDMQKALAGKSVSCSPSINGYTESFEGESSVKDLETLLQLVNLYFTAPRYDQDAYLTLVSMLHAQVLNKESNPKAIFRDSINLMASDHSPRTVLMNEGTLEQLNQGDAYRIYRERFANAADFTFTFVGNIDPADAAFRKAVCTWLGSLKTKNAREKYKDHEVRVPAGEKKNVFQRPMAVHTASNRIQFTSYDLPYTLSNMLNMEILGRILSTRYLESIREREGGSYGVGCAGYMQMRPVPSATLLMQFDTDPDKQARLLEIIYEEVREIAFNGPLAEDLQKEKASMKKDFVEDCEKNSWWSEEALPYYYRYGIDYVNSYEAAVDALTAETVRDTLRRLLESGNVFEVIMMPEK